VGFVMKGRDIIEFRDTLLFRCLLVSFRTYKVYNFVTAWWIGRELCFLRQGGILSLFKTSDEQSDSSSLGGSVSMISCLVIVFVLSS